MATALPATAAPPANTSVSPAPPAGVPINARIAARVVALTGALGDGTEVNARG